MAETPGVLQGTAPRKAFLHDLEKKVQDLRELIQEKSEWALGQEWGGQSFQNYH